MDNFDSKPVTIDPIKITDGYLDKADWRVNENSNSGFSNGGLILHQAGATASHYWLYKIFDEEVRNAHINCDIHLHDLSLVQPYCAGWNLGTLIKEGFGGVRNKIDCGPAKHLNTISQQLVNFLGCMQLEWNGAQAVNSFDTFLAPFLRVERDAYIKEVKDLTGQKELTQSQLDKIEKKLEKYAQQCMQNFLYGINVPSRWGSQAPFSNVTLDLECPPDLKNKKVEMAGKTFDFTYGDCQKEMDMINKAFLRTYELGDYSENGFQYPIITVNVDEEFDYDNEVSELLFKITAKYGTPYFSNFVNTGMSKSDLRSMCCRLRLDLREIRKTAKGGLFGAADNTGSVGVVTINLPRIGYLTKGSEEKFFERLDELLVISKNALEQRRKACQHLYDIGLFPYTKRYLTQGFANHFSTIAINGMNECVLNFMGKTLDAEEAKNFALKVQDYILNRCSDFQEETGHLYNFEASPSESVSFRFFKHDRKQYPNILSMGDVPQRIYSEKEEF